MGLVVAMACVTWRGPLILQLDFPFGSSVQVHHPTSYTASSGVFPRRIRTECVREVKRFHNEKGKGNCSTRNIDRKRSSFWLQTPHDKFYPDFVAMLTDGRILVVEYKGKHL